MSELKTYRRKDRPENNLITQTPLQFANELKKYSGIFEIGSYALYFNLFKKYRSRKMKGYTLKTLIDTNEKRIEVYAYNPQKELEFKDVCELSTTSYMLRYETTYVKEKVYQSTILNPNNAGLVSQYENGKIDAAGKKTPQVRVMRNKTAFQSNPKCVYVMKDLSIGKKYYHIESDISSDLLNHTTLPLITGKDFELVEPPKAEKKPRTKVDWDKYNKNANFNSIDGK